MKQFLKFSILLFLATGLFSSCKKDEITSPTLLFIGDEGYTYQATNLAPGDSVKVGFSCNSNGSDDLASLKFTANDQLISTLDFGAGVKNINVTGYLMKYATDEDNWAFELVDVKGNTSSLTMTLTKDLSLADVEDITGVVLGAQNNTAEKPMYSITDEATYTIAEGDADAAIQAKIDFICYYDDVKNKNGMHLASPNANWDGTLYDFTSWAQKNEASFIIETPFEAEDFGILTKTKIQDAYDAAALNADNVKRKSQNMATDNIYLFKTYDGKYGALKVNSVSDESATGSVNFDIKIEK